MPAPQSFNKHAASAEQQVADILRSNNWSVEELPSHPGDGDLIIEREEQRFVVEIKALSESRPDRVIPMLSMAILQAQAAAKQSGNVRPLAIVYVPDASPTLERHVDRFVQKVAKDVPIGIISKRGSRYFRGAAFQDLNQLSEDFNRSATPHASQTVNLFSDLNQWMLKLLLAWELPDGLLNAPRERIRNGAELANVARVSTMSASRFLQQLRSQGHLSDSSPYLRLVRREELFRRWGAATMRSSQELPCHFLIRAPVQQQIRALLGKHLEDACLGLFAAADALNIGHVSGVPPYVYVHKIPQIGGSDWSQLMAHPTDRPDLILRQAPFPQSTFRGAIEKNGIMVADIIQVWLDVMHHPARGMEQADMIYKKYLLPNSQS